MAAEFPLIQYVIPGLVVSGLTVMAGPPKVGKSWLALGGAVAVSSGGRALGKIPVAQGDVLYLALEDPPRRLQTRLKALLGCDPAPARLHLRTTCSPMGSGGETEISSFLDTHPDTRLVVVDVMAKVRPGVSDRANRYDARVQP